MKKRVFLKHDLLIDFKECTILGLYSILPNMVTVFDFSGILFASIRIFEKEAECSLQQLFKCSFSSLSFHSNHKKVIYRKRKSKTSKESVDLKLACSFQFHHYFTSFHFFSFVLHMASMNGVCLSNRSISFRPSWLFGCWLFEHVHLAFFHWKPSLLKMFFSQSTVVPNVVANLQTVSNTLSCDTKIFKSQS